ncbi:MAG: Na-K-Cl cotransporter [Acidobacteriota bacterium]
MSEKTSIQPEPANLGTFLGVFTPSILTILGVVLFLRTGWVVSQVGLVPALSIVLLAHVITVATALSVSAVATNMHVGAGGAYYMISRSLGLELGGAIGIPLFLAQTFSVTLYSFGFAESLELFWPGLPQKPVAAVTVLVVSLIAGRSTQLALKLQLPIMVAIVCAIGSLFVGAGQRAGATLPLFQGSPGEAGYWTVFAVFFPAVTGIMAGISLSGDLADSKKSIPTGTLAAVAVGLGVYLIVPIALAATAAPEDLAANNLIWFDIALVPWLIIPGLLGAIVSSALGSILGAPRTLEALMEDRVLPKPPSKILGVPLAGQGVAHFFATAVALAAVGLGDLNAVAPVLTMFFLTTYGMVNLVAGLEQLSGAPSYRPSIRVPWYVSIGGAIGCLWVMSLINLWAALAALVIEIGVYAGLRRRSLSASWGDLRYGALISLARATLLRLRSLPVDPRNWRPHILVFAGDPQKRVDLLRFAAWLNQKRGILTLCQLRVGRLEDLASQTREATEAAERFLDSEGIVAFAETEIVPSFEEGVLAIAQANGIAGISSNTLMFGWADEPTRMHELLSIVRQVELLGKSTLICRIAPRRWSSKLRRIDIWWGGLENNGDLLMLFAYLLSVNPEWRNTTLQVKTIASNAMTGQKTEKSLDELIERCRIKARTKVLTRKSGETVHEIIQAESQEADLVLLGLQSVAEGEEPAYLERLQKLVGNLPTVIFVRAGGEFAGRLL